MRNRIIGVLASAVLAMALAAPGAVAAPANPPQNQAPPGSATGLSPDPTGLAALNAAQASEGLPALSLPADFNSLAPAQELFVLLNEERITRSLPPATALASVLDQASAAGAAANRDPQMPLNLAVTSGASIWGEGGSIPDIVFAWMYDDGWGGSAANTPNLDCTSPSAPACWGHRDAILGNYGPSPLMGAAAISAPGAAVSAAAIFTPAVSGAASDATWVQVAGGASGSPTGTSGSGTSAPPAPAPTPTPAPTPAPTPTPTPTPVSPNGSGASGSSNPAGLCGVLGICAGNGAPTMPPQGASGSSQHGRDRSGGPSALRGCLASLFGSGGRGGYSSSGRCGYRSGRGGLTGTETLGR